MALDGLFTQVELFCDIAIAASFNNAAHHFKLARSKAVGLVLGHGCLLHQIVESRDQVDNALAANPVVAGRDGADGGLQMAGQGVFEQDLDGGRAVHDGAHGLQTGEARHLHIEQQDVGLQFKGLGDGLVAVGGLADHLEAVLLDKHVAHSDANYRVVVCQYDSNRSFHLKGCLRKVAKIRPVILPPAYAPGSGRRHANR